MKSQSALEVASSNLTIQQSVVVEHSKIVDLRQQNTNLRHRLSAAESEEADARAQTSNRLQDRVDELEKEKKKQQNGNDAPKILGRKCQNAETPNQVSKWQFAGLGDGLSKLMIICMSSSFEAPITSQRIFNIFDKILIFSTLSLFLSKNQLF